jgi:uncharacterized repeat protein (TIGR01451 family)
LLIVHYQGGHVMRRRDYILGLIVFVVLGLMPLLTGSAAPLRQLSNPLIVVSNEGQAGPDVDRTLIRSTTDDPITNWRGRFFDPVGWQDAYPVMRAPAWTSSPHVDPLLADGADHIWGGTPGGPLTDDDGNPTTYPRRYDGSDYDNGHPIPTSPGPQYLFLRRDFCLPINALANPLRHLTAGDISITLLNATDSASVPDGAASVWLNDSTIGWVPGDESGNVTVIDVPDPAFLYRGRNTLAMRVGDARSDDRAAILYRAAFGYAIDPSAIIIGVNTTTPFEQEVVQFNVATDGLSGRSPYNYGWTFGDGGGDTTSSVNHAYLSSGTYTVNLTIADTESCTGTAALPITVLPFPLTITKTAQPDPVTAGETLRYRITAQNDSPIRALTSVVITDDLPAGTTFSFCTGGCVPPTPPDRTVRWELGNLGPQESSILDLYVTVALTTFGTLTNTAYGAQTGEVYTDGVPVAVEVLPPPCLVALTGVEITGPVSGLIGSLHTFTATIAPPDATEPVTYTWTPPPVSGQSTPAATYRWTTPGSYAITLTAKNCGGTVTATHTMSVCSPCPRPLTGVGISGRTGGFVDTAYDFVGVTSPANATQPVTYTWLPPPLGGQSTPTATYRWTAPGSYAITLTAGNCGGTFSATHTIAIEARQRSFAYLPMVLRDFPYDAPDACPGWSLSIDEPFDEDFDHVADRDWFTFQATVATSYTIRTQDLQIRADTVITLYDSTCAKVLATNDDLPYPSNSRASQVEWRAEATGALHVLVRSYEPSFFGPDTGYSLAVYDEDNPAPPIDDAPDFCDAAYPLVAGEPYTNDLDHANDNDWFVFDVVAGRTYTIATGDLDARANTALELWEADCLTQLAIDDDPAGPEAQLVWPATASGQLCANVRHHDWTVYGVDTGYTVTVEEE